MILPLEAARDRGKDARGGCSAAALPSCFIPSQPGRRTQELCHDVPEKDKAMGRSYRTAEVLGGPLCRQELDLMIHTGPFHLGIFCDPLWGYSG